MPATKPVSLPLNPDQPGQPRKRGRRWMVVLFIVLALLAGVGIGIAAGDQGSTIAQQKHTIAALHSQVADLQARLSGDEATTRQAQQAAQTAQQQAATADRRAKAKYRAEYAQRLAAVNALQRKLTREQRVVSSSTISGSGVYVIGQDIAPGTYHTAGDGSGAAANCYYALLSSTNTSDIIDNNNFGGPETVSTAGAHALEIDGDCTWRKIG